MPRVYTQCFRNSTHPATLILRALAAGVMLALAVIHVVPDGMNDLAELAEYPYGPLAVVFGVLVMVCTESLSRAFMHKHHLDDNTADAAAKPAAPLPAIADEATSSHARNSDFHSHTCVAVNNAAGWATSPQAASVRLQIIAYMFEIACVVHSFLIGEHLQHLHTHLHVRHVFHGLPACCRRSLATFAFCLTSCAFARCSSQVWPWASPSPAGSKQLL